MVKVRADCTRGFRRVFSGEGGSTATVHVGVDEPGRQDGSGMTHLGLAWRQSFSDLGDVISDDLYPARCMYAVRRDDL